MSESLPSYDGRHLITFLQLVDAQNEVPMERGDAKQRA